MPVIVIVIVLGLLGGVAVGLQSPLASLMAGRVGSMSSVFVIHLSGAIAAGLFLLPQRGGGLGHWRSVPWYALGAGVLGLIVVSAANYVIPRRGAVVLIFLVVTGQLITSLIIDHFGLFEIEARSLDPSRLIGVALLFLGVWLIVR